jgi:hypothetical protein
MSKSTERFFYELSLGKQRTAILKEAWMNTDSFLRTIKAITLVILITITLNIR